MAVLHRLNYLNPVYTYRHRRNVKRRVDALTKPLREKAARFGIGFNHNDRFMLSLKDSKIGQPAFVIGNGPSLCIADLEKLKDYLTFGANKIYLAFAESSFRPSYYFVEDNLVLQQNWQQINALRDVPKFHPKKGLEWAPRINSSYYYDFYWEDPKSPSFPSFGTNPVCGFYWGSTVIYSMIQFAFYMGCNPIILIGVDFSFDLPKTPAKGIELKSEGEKNHFHPDYRKPGEKWNIPNLDIQLKTFQKVAAWASMNGVQVFNATRGGKLEVFDRIDLDTFLQMHLNTKPDEKL